MDVQLVVWVTLPLVGGLMGWMFGWMFGYFGSRIAVKMMRPTPLRQREIAEAIAAAMGPRLLGHDDLMRGLSKLDLRQLIGEFLDQRLGAQFKERGKLPLVGSMLTHDRIRNMHVASIASILASEEQLLEKLEAARAGLGMPALVTEGVASFPVPGSRGPSRCWRRSWPDHCSYGAPRTC